MALWEQEDQDSGSEVCEEGLPAAVLRWCSPRGDWQFTDQPGPLPALGAASAFPSVLYDDIPVHPSCWVTVSLENEERWASKATLYI